MKIWTKLISGGPSAGAGEITPPIGALMDYGGDADPDNNWMVANGRTLDSVADPSLAALYARIGTRFGGTGPASFNLPDAQGRVTVGKGTHAEVDAVGDSDGLAVASRKLKHSHGRGTLAITSSGTLEMMGYFPDGVTLLYHAINTGGAGQSNVLGGYVSEGYTDGFLRFLGASHTHTTSGTIGDTAGPLDGPAYLVTQKIIRVR
jgi:microcystin-dependent protein